MISEKKRLANQKNARKSTGPRTDAGKAVSSKNALTHGLRSAAVLLPDENVEEFDAFAATFREELAPADALQRSLVDRIIFLNWKLARLPHAESVQLRWGRAEFGGDRDQLSSLQVIGKTICYTIDRGLSSLQRYETRIEQSLHANMKLLIAAQKAQRDSEAKSTKSENSRAMIPPESDAHDSFASAFDLQSSAHGVASNEPADASIEPPSLAPNEPTVAPSDDALTERRDPPRVPSPAPNEPTADLDREIIQAPAESNPAFFSEWPRARGEPTRNFEASSPKSARDGFDDDCNEVEQDRVPHRNDDLAPRARHPDATSFSVRRET